MFKLLSLLFIDAGKAAKKEKFAKAAQSKTRRMALETDGKRFAVSHPKY